LEFLALDTINSVDKFVTIYTQFAVCPLIILKAMGKIIEAVAFVEVSAKRTERASLGLLIVVETGVT
jgi:hypothetical protein